MESLMVDKFSDDLKKMVEVKKELMARRDAVSDSIKGGGAYFATRLSGASAKELDGGARRMNQLIKEYDAITKEINDMDLIIISSIEAYTGNFVSKIKTSHKINDAGDINESKEAYLVPFTMSAFDMIQITPDDIWFLKMVKEAYRPSNVSFIKKEDL